MEVSVAWRLGRFTLGEKPLPTHWTEGWVRPRAGVGDLENMKFLDPVGNQTMLTRSIYFNVYSKTAKQFVNNYTVLFSVRIFYSRG